MNQAISSSAAHSGFSCVADPASVDAAIRSRFSARAYAPREVPDALLREVLDVARHAPSGTNTQPWRVYVLRGAARQALVRKVCAAHDAAAADPAVAAQHQPSYDYYPSRWESPYIERRRACGLGMYQVLGIAKGDKARMHAQHQENYRFFGAPVGLLFTIDRVMGRGSLLDYGMFVQSVMLAARARGLHTCAQAAWNDFADIVMEHIGAAASEMLVCGMAMGYADESAAVNTLRTQRESVESFSRWLD